MAMKKKPEKPKAPPTETQLLQIERDRESLALDYQILRAMLDADTAETPNSVMIDALLAYIGILLQQPETQYATFDIALDLTRKYLARFDAEVDQFQYHLVRKEG